MVVRVRTFVALRHWILNYFMDDFVVDYNLRLTFCSLLNDFVDELSQDPRGRKSSLRSWPSSKSAGAASAHSTGTGPNSTPPSAPTSYPARRHRRPPQCHPEPQLLGSSPTWTRGHPSWTPSSPR